MSMVEFSAVAKHFGTTQVLHGVTSENGKNRTLRPRERT